MLGTLRHEITTGWRALLLWGVGFAIGAQVFMMLALMLRFQAVPNYGVVYDWPGNVWHIIRSTPSVRDMLPIIAEEWLIEIGRMNYDYGNGISVWALNVVPSRLVMLAVLGAMVGLCVRLMRMPQCSTTLRSGAGVATGTGTVLVAMTNFTMSWVVCCATPNWVVGLSMLGLGVSASLALETLGPAIALTGFACLIVAILGLARRKSRLTLVQTEPLHA